MPKAPSTNNDQPQLAPWSLSNTRKAVCRCLRRIPGFSIGGGDFSSGGLLLASCGVTAYVVRAKNEPLDPSTSRDAHLPMLTLILMIFHLFVFFGLLVIDSIKTGFLRLLLVMLSSLSSSSCTVSASPLPASALGASTDTLTNNIFVHLTGSIIESMSLKQEFLSASVLHPRRQTYLSGTPSIRPTETATPKKHVLRFTLSFVGSFRQQVSLMLKCIEPAHLEVFEPSPAANVHPKPGTGRDLIPVPLTCSGPCAWMTGKPMRFPSFSLRRLQGLVCR